MNFDKDDEKSKPVIPDSTLGDDKKGFQMLANKKAAQNGSPAPKQEPITTSSMADGLRALLQGKGYADGGEVAESPIITRLRAYIMGSGGDLTADQRNGQSADSIENSSGTAKGYADGGEVSDPADQLAALLSNGGNGNGLPWMQGAAQNLMSVPTPNLSTVPGAPPSLAGLTQPQAPQPQAPAPMPPVAPQPAAPHPLRQTAQAMTSVPDTSPSIYQGISADDRMAMQQKLMAQQNSPMSLLGKGLSGLGDAVNNSYGNGHSTFAKDNQANMDNHEAQALSGIDTARSQKLQDIQGPMAQQMADPKSPIAMSMRKTLQSAGLQIPSGMPPSIMLQISGPLGELAMKQATLSVQQQQVNATQSNQEAERHLQAAKDLQDRGIVRKGWEAVTGDSPETAAMRDELHATGHKGGSQAPHGIPDLGSTFNGHKVLSVKRVQ